MTETTLGWTKDQFWKLAVLSSMPAIIGFIVSERYFSVGVLITLMLYGVLMTGIHEELKEIQE